MKNKFKPQRFRIFQNNNQVILSVEKDRFSIDIEKLLSTINNFTKEEKKSLNDYDISIVFMGIKLTGGIESSNPLFQYFFGTLDSKSNMQLDESFPIYYFSPSDENYNLGTLTIFLDSVSLILLNYSLLDSSLNIKLELTNKESKEKQNKAKAKAKEQKHIKEHTKTISTAFLNPILENDILKCPHNGVVKLQSHKGKSFKDNNIPMVLESDLINSQIIGCTNNIAGIPTPCTFVSIILPNARALKKYNDDYPIMQDLINGNVFSDKGFPIICTPKANKFRINSPNPSSVTTKDKESLISHIDTSVPSLNIVTHYKDLEEYYFTPSTYEYRESKEHSIISQSGFYAPNDTLDITLPPLLKDRDYTPLDSNPTLASLLQDISTLYNPVFFSYRIVSIRVAYSIYEYLLIIPKTIPKYIAKLLKDKREKEQIQYGYGRFIDLQRDYIRDMDRTKEDITLLHIQGKVLLAPSGCERMRIEVG